MMKCTFHIHSTLNRLLIDKNDCFICAMWSKSITWKRIRRRNDWGGSSALSWFKPMFYHITRLEQISPNKSTWMKYQQNHKDVLLLPWFWRSSGELIQMLWTSIALETRFSMFKCKKYFLYLEINIFGNGNFNYWWNVTVVITQIPDQC